MGRWTRRSPSSTSARRAASSRSGRRRARRLAELDYVNAVDVRRSARSSTWRGIERLAEARAGRGGARWPRSSPSSRSATARPAVLMDGERPVARARLRGRAAGARSSPRTTAVRDPFAATLSPRLRRRAQPRRSSSTGWSGWSRSSRLSCAPTARPGQPGRQRQRRTDRARPHTRRRPPPAARPRSRARHRSPISPSISTAAARVRPGHSGSDRPLAPPLGQRARFSHASMPARSSCAGSPAGAALK